MGVGLGLLLRVVETMGCFFFFWVWMLDYGLLVVVVLGVCSAVVMGLW